MSFSSRPTTIPPSPTSPPESGSTSLKRRRLSDNLPQSPISPSYMSVATKSYVSSYGSAHNANEATGRSSPGSPRGSASRSQQSSRPTHSLPTPAHSIAGTNSGFDVVEDGDQHRDKRPRLEQSADQMEVEPGSQATNHDRKDQMDGERTQDSEGADVLMADERTTGQLQEDMGHLFLLCKSKVERQRPDPKQHLLSLYGLGPLLHSVARTDPRTGEKINKLRKSYEGQIKSFGLAGKMKPIKGERNIEEDQPGPLRRMVGSSAWGLQSDEQWTAEHAQTKIEVTDDFKARLQRAMQLQPGKVKDTAKWEDEIGLEKSKPGNQHPHVHQAQPGAPRPMVNGAVKSNQQVPSDFRRNTRGKKRGYGDDSFVGYGEGYPEDDDDDRSRPNKRGRFDEDD